MAACCSRISRSASIIFKTLPQAAISKVVIERPAKLCRISIYAARPGVIIGKKGSDIEKLKKLLGKMTGSRSQPQHRRDPQAGNRRAPRRAGRRRPARAPYRLPPRDEARGAVGPAPRRRRHPDHLRAAVSAARKSRAPNGIARAAFRCTRCAATSIMPRRRRTPLTASAASRCGSSRARSSAMTRSPRIA